MPTVQLPSGLRALAGDRAAHSVPGATVGEVLQGLVARHAALGPKLFDERGRLTRYLNVFVGEDDVRALDLLETRVGADAVLVLVQAIAGG